VGSCRFARKERREQVEEMQGEKYTDGDPAKQGGQEADRPSLISTDDSSRQQRAQEVWKRVTGIIGSSLPSLDILLPSRR
jgi:hypothetical protein